MAKVKFELNKAGVRHLLKSSEMQEVISQEANRIRNTAGDGYEMEVTNVNRAVGFVYADTVKAKRSNAKHNTLLKALRNG